MVAEALLRTCLPCLLCVLQNYFSSHLLFSLLRGCPTCLFNIPSGSANRFSALPPHAIPSAVLESPDNGKAYNYHLGCCFWCVGSDILPPCAICMPSHRKELELQCARRVYRVGKQERRSILRQLGHTCIHQYAARSASLLTSNPLSEKPPNGRQDKDGAHRLVYHGRHVSDSPP